MILKPWTGWAKSCSTVIDF